MPTLSDTYNAASLQQEPITNDRTAEVKKALIRWQMRVSEYLSLGEKESDPVGKKFYQSYALGVANCIAEVTDILVGREPNAV